jgi:hypothetical protein
MTGVLFYYSLQIFEKVEIQRHSLGLLKNMANYKTRKIFWCSSSPIASLGLLLFEKNIMG